MPEPQQRVVSLRSAVERIVSGHPALATRQFGVAGAEAALGRVKRKRRPDLKLKATTGLTPEARGDVVFSPDQSTDVGSLGPFYRLELEAVQPLTTFGKIAAAKSAAEHGVLLREADRDKTADELALDVVRAYWILESARRGVALANELNDDYGELLSKVEEAVADPESEVDSTRLLEVRSLEYQIAQTYRESLQKEAVSGKIMETLLGYAEMDGYRIDEVVTPSFSPPPELAESLIPIALGLSAEIRQANEAVEVMEARVQQSQSESLPDVFLAASAHFAEAPNRTDQKNPFVFDPFNTRGVGAALGLRWNLNFADHGLETARRLAELSAARTTLQLLEEKKEVEVIKAVAEAESHSALLAAARRSLKAAKSWLRLSLDNWELGIGSVSRLVDAYDSYYNLSRVAIEREAQFNLSLARVALVSGSVSLYLDWTESGVVPVS